jgi:tetratricopeptide (TPR) repeat protein
VGLKLRKLGLESEYEFEVQEFQLLPGDVIILGSDGRDDLNLTPNENFKVINEDETLFLRVVEEASGEIPEIERVLKTKGELTDDLSLLRLCFVPNLTEQSITNGFDGELSQKLETSKIQEINRLYQESKKLYFAGDIATAKTKLEEAYKLNQNIPKLNKLYGLLCFKTKDYAKAAYLFLEYLGFEPNDQEIEYYLLLSHKKTGNYSRAIELGERLLARNPDDVAILTNLSDLYRIQGNLERARELADKVLSIDSENQNIKKILASLSK